jgi:putative ABC transport system substrate-binding protein
MLLLRHTKRREFIAGLGSAAAWPVVARAQQPAVPVIGYLHPSLPEHYAYQVAAFRKGLSEMGFVEGRNVAIEFRWAQDHLDRLPEFAAELVRRRVDLIAAPGSPAAALAAKTATATIPIVFTVSVDPVESGLVASLNRPGGNLTGLSDMQAEINPKRLGLLRGLLPGASRFGLLINPNYLTANSIIKHLQTAASALGTQIEALTASSVGEIDTAFASLPQKRIDALIVPPEVLFLGHRVQLVTLAARYAIPVIYTVREYVEIGGLMSYGSNPIERNRQAGIYAGRILKGEKPADLPVVQPTRFKLVINLKTAKALGLTIPETLLATADEVIQ